MEAACKILWVEDESMLRELMCELLSVEGYHCVPAKNGLEAQKHLEETEFHILISDFQMPEMSGDKLLFWLREKEFHMPVIFVSGQIERKQSEELALKDCCTSMLMKPFSIDQLIEEINRARERDHLFNCTGKVIPEGHADFQNSFPKQHLRN